MKERLLELRRRLFEAWPIARRVAADPVARIAWLKTARAAQITLLCVFLGGVTLAPIVIDAAADVVLPPKSRRVFFRRTVRRHPGAEVLGSLGKALYWLGGLGATGALLVLHAPKVAPGRREATSADALAETMAGSAPVVIDPLGATLAPSSAGGDAPEEATPPSRYDVQGSLGEGGMGVVYRAEDRTLGRVVALKRLRGDRLDDATRERFRREARVLAQLDHPGIVQVYDLAEEPTGLWMAMELVTGGGLDHLIAREGKLPVPRVARLGAALAETLAFAHEKGVVHRDFKPANVLMTESGEPKITDFGLAKLRVDGPKLTQTGALLGSPGYMSPEQASGGDIDHRADVYALGVTLFEMLSGRCPFEGDTASVLAAHITQPPPRLEDIGTPVPAALEALLSRLLAKSPDARPDDLTEVATELRAVVESSSVAEGVE